MTEPSPELRESFDRLREQITRLASELPERVREVPEPLMEAARNAQAEVERLERMIFPPKA